MVKDVDTCRGWLIGWLSLVNRGMLMWLQSADDSLSKVVVHWTRVLLHDLVCCNGKCRCLLLGDASLCCLVMQVSAARYCRCLVLGGAASMAGCCIVILWYLQRGVVRRPEVIFRRLSEISS